MFLCSWPSVEHGAGSAFPSAFCMECLEGGFLLFPLWLLFYSTFWDSFCFKQTRRLKKSCHPRRRHAFSNPPVWERSQLDEQREGPHVWDQRRQVNARVRLRPGESVGPSPGLLSRAPPSRPHSQSGPKGGRGSGGDLLPSWRPLIYSFNRQPGSAKHCRPLRD